MHLFRRVAQRAPPPTATLVTRSYSTTISTLLSPTTTISEQHGDTSDAKKYVGILLPHQDLPSPTSEKVDVPPVHTKQTSIQSEMTDLPILQPANAADPPSTEMTTLSNGVRVVSQETFRQCTTISALIQVGSRYEDDETAGCTHLIEQMAFKATENRSHAEVVGALESIGGVPSATASREEMVYSVDVLREHTKSAVELLSDCVTRPKMLPEELEDSRQVVGFLLEMSRDQVSGNVQGNVMEELTSVAFGGSSDSSSSLKPLGRPLFYDPNEEQRSSPHPTVTTVKEFHANHFVGENIVVSAAGLLHSEAVELATEYFGHIPRTSGNQEVQQKREAALVQNEYVGGCRLVSIPNLDFVHVGLGFETGGWHDSDLVPACVLVALLGGGDSFSAGGPGKGMYSRLYREVLNMCGWVESILGVSLIHTDIGCVGIVGSTEPQYANSLYRVMCDQWLSAANEPVDDIALSRARNRLKSSVLMNLESRLVLGDDMARQVATYGKRESSNAVCRRIDAVTKEDLMRVAQRGLASNPSVVAYGDLTHIPDNIHELVTQALRAGQ
jgi:processing peptidase subunit alpha